MTLHEVRDRLVELQRTSEDGWPCDARRCLDRKRCGACRAIDSAEELAGEVSRIVATLDAAVGP